MSRSATATPAVAADILEAEECIFTATGKGFDPAFEGLGMDMEDGADGVGVLVTVKK